MLRAGGEAISLGEGLTGCSGTLAGLKGVELWTKSVDRRTNVRRTRGFRNLEHRPIVMETSWKGELV